MISHYERLVKEHGKEYANKYMKELRLKVKKPGRKPNEEKPSQIKNKATQATQADNQ